MARTTDVLSTRDIDAFTDKLQNTIALASEAIELRAMLAKFGATFQGQGRRTAGRPAAQAPKRAAAKGTRRRTRQPGIPPEKVLAALKTQKEAVSLGAITKKLGESKERVAAALRKLRDEKKAKVTGDKRLAKWSAV